MAIHLALRQQDLLDNWRAACENDFSLKGVASLTRKQFNNEVPVMLNVLGRRLQGETEKIEFSVLAAAHGLHRWQKGYSLSELAAEMQHLYRLLLSELRTFWQLRPLRDNSIIALSYEYLAEFGNHINTGSITQYADLQRQAALSRAEALQAALNEINEVGKRRSDLLRHSSHDLRGSFGALQGAAALLETVIDSDEERKQFLEILHRNLANCRSLITQLMDLARLEAGHEVLQIQPVDVGQLLTGLVMAYQPLANERGLLLKRDGPTNLPVECDPILLQRIIQNLVLNALKHTPSGWVSVSWAMENDFSWTVCVQDTGPGLPAATETSSIDPIRTAETHVKEALVGQTSDTAFAHKGEGIGLSIVKGLCELLRASLYIESKPGEGTMFRIKLTRNNC